MAELSLLLTMPVKSVVCIVVEILKMCRVLRCFGVDLGLSVLKVWVWSEKCEVLDFYFFTADIFGCGRKFVKLKFLL